MISASRILIIKWGALGDIVASTPALRAVRESFPQAKITILSNSLMKEVVPEGTLADEILVHDQYSPWRLFRELRRRKFDAAVNLRWMSDRSAIITRLSGAKYRASTGPKNLMFLYNLKMPHPIGAYHEIFRNSDIVKLIGAELKNTTPYVFISKQDEQFAENFFSRNNLSGTSILAMHPGASKMEKAWKSERFIEIGKKFIDEFQSPIVITWGGSERTLAESVAKEFGSFGFVCDQTKRIGELAAVQKRCSMFLCNCSGPMNVAMATETPIVALLGASDPDDWGPYGKNHRVVKSPFFRESYTNEEERIAMESISVDMVWDMVSSRWNELMIAGQKVSA